MSIPTLGRLETHKIPHLHHNSRKFMPLNRHQLKIYAFSVNSMFVPNGYFCRESKFVVILRPKLRFLLRKMRVDSDFTQNF